MSLIKFWCYAFLWQFQWLVESTVVCEKNTFAIYCSMNTTIHIVQANYGRTDRDTCTRILGFEFLTSCIYHNTLQILEKHCQNRTTCSISVNDDFFQERWLSRCLLISKYLNLTYYCKGFGEYMNGTEWVFCGDSQTEQTIERTLDSNGFIGIGVIIGCIY